MTSNESNKSRERLVGVLAEVFHLPLEKLADDLRERIAGEFFPLAWDRLSPEQRKRFAAQLDDKHDPEYQAATEYWDQFFERRSLLIKEIENWEMIAAPTAMDLAKKTEMLESLRRRLADMDQEQSEAAGDSCATDTVAVPELTVGSAKWRSMNAQAAAEARHNKPGGSRDKQSDMRRFWASGKYKSRDQCAEAECGALNISFSTARKALRNTPAP